MTDWYVFQCHITDKTRQPNPFSFMTASSDITSYQMINKRLQVMIIENRRGGVGVRRESNRGEVRGGEQEGRERGEKGSEGSREEERVRGDKKREKERESEGGRDREGH